MTLHAKADAGPRAQSSLQSARISRFGALSRAECQFWTGSSMLSIDRNRGAPMAGSQEGADDVGAGPHPTPQSYLPLELCNGIYCGEILAAIKSAEDVRQFWLGFRAMRALCILLLLL